MGEDEASRYPAATMIDSTAAGRVQAIDVARGFAVCVGGFALVSHAFDFMGAMMLWFSIIGVFGVLIGASSRVGAAPRSLILVRTVLLMSIGVALAGCRISLPNQYSWLSLWVLLGLVLRRAGGRSLWAVGVLSAIGLVVIDLSLTGGVQGWLDGGSHIGMGSGFGRSGWRHQLFSWLILPLSPLLVPPIAGMLIARPLALASKRPRSWELWTMCACLAAYALFLMGAGLLRQKIAGFACLALGIAMLGIAFLTTSAWMIHRGWLPNLRAGWAATGRLALSWSFLGGALVLAIGPEFLRGTLSHLAGGRLLVASAAMLPLLVSPWLLRRVRRGPVETALHWLVRDGGARPLAPGPEA